MDPPSNGNTVHVKNDPGDDDDKPSFCKKITNVINSGLEAGFAKIGSVVAKHPAKTIIISFLVTGLCMIGLLEYQVENRGEKNWVSQSSDAIKHKDWVDDRFPNNFRVVDIMLQELNVGDILTKDGLLELYDIHEKILKIGEGKANIQWKDICYVNVGSECVPTSILMFWNFNKTIIQSLTKNDIMDVVNRADLTNPFTNQVMNIKLLIGSIKYNETDNRKIIAAGVATGTYKLKNQEEFKKSKGRPVDEIGEEWEELFDGVMEKWDEGNLGYRLFYFSQWGSSEASSNASNGDLQFFVIGYIFVIVYLAIMLGSFSKINQKIYLAIAGIAVIGMSIGIAYGLGSAFQLKSTAVHNVLPFLLLGIGVDDIFVIIQNWDNIGGPEINDKPVHEKTAAAMRHAGVSILVTSITDVCAFMIGASTILPALKSFCVWSGLGILAVFFLTITFFLAWVSMDSKRQQKRRDACCCCIKLADDYEEANCSRRNYLQLFIKNYYAPVLLSIPGKIISLLIVFGCLAGGIVGVLKLEQEFDFNWFLPKSSPPRQYTDNYKIFFPSGGITSNAYTGRIEYNNEIEKMEKIYQELSKDKFVASGTVYSWHHDFLIWANTTNLCPSNTTVLTECKFANQDVFNTNLQLFLKSIGRAYENNLAFADDNKTVIAAAIEFKHKILDGSAEEIDAMESVQGEIKPGLIHHPHDTEDLLPFVHSFAYVSFETNKVISKELTNNLAYASICVFVVTLFLLSHLGASLIVLLGVVMALVDVAGYMHFWGLTIDTVTTIIMVIAIGLTVDYSAHIAHGFMTAGRGDKNERMKAALVEIGPAVIHGAMSTLLAFILLAASESYVFKTFFKVFFLVVVFGMLHGMIFLPVVMSLIGPQPYKVEKGERRHSSYYNHPKHMKGSHRSKSNDQGVQLEKVTKNGDGAENPGYTIENQ